MAKWLIIARWSSFSIESVLLCVTLPSLCTQVNVLLSELGEFDDSPLAQKVYNHYSWYLLVVVVFYGIPAYQLVITSQRVSRSVVMPTLSHACSLASVSRLSPNSFTIIGRQEKIKTRNAPPISFFLASQLNFSL